MDAAIYEVASYLEDKFNLTQEQAVARINDGGYQIYTTANLDMQEYVEQRYADINNLVESSRVAKWQDIRAIFLLLWVRSVRKPSPSAGTTQPWNPVSPVRPSNR